LGAEHPPVLSAEHTKNRRTVFPTAGVASSLLFPHISISSLPKKLFTLFTLQALQPSSPFKLFTLQALQPSSSSTLFTLQALQASSSSSLFNLQALQPSSSSTFKLFNFKLFKPLQPSSSSSLFNIQALQPSSTFKLFNPFQASSSSTLFKLQALQPSSTLKLFNPLQPSTLFNLQPLQPSTSSSITSAAQSTVTCFGLLGVILLQAKVLVTESDFQDAGGYHRCRLPRLLEGRTRFYASQLHNRPEPSNLR
jgi:hypothetical protein